MHFASANKLLTDKPGGRSEEERKGGRGDGLA